MKKKRFFALAAIIFAIVMSFTACSSELSVARSFDVVLNKGYVAQNKPTENVTQISELKGDAFLDAKGEFMTFLCGDGDSEMVTKVFSTRNKKVVYSEASSATQSVDITLYSNLPAFTVVKTAIDQQNSGDGFGSTCELYDATGALVAKSNSPKLKAISFADTVLFDCVAYSINENNGALTKIADIPENLYVEDCSDWNEDYFYTYGNTVNVYTRDFVHVYSWTMPSWAEWVSKNTLNNGNVLVQYLRPLDNMTEDYDIYEMDSDTGEIKKYELFSLILDPAKKTEKEIKLDYVVNQVSTKFELFNASGNNGMYLDVIQNIAYVYPIINGQADSSDASADIVLMNNNGKITKSLKIVDDQIAALPTNLASNVYIVATVYGSALVDIDGNVLEQINNIGIDAMGKNIVTDGNVYTLDMEQVYSLYDNGASVITYLDDTVFVKESSDTEYSVIAIKGTEQTVVCSVNLLDTSAVYFEELNDSACYAICNPLRGEYMYYNSEHKLLHTSATRLNLVASDYKHGITLYSTTVGNDTTYYVFY